MNQLNVQTDGVRAYGQIHDQVATSLSQLMGGAAPAAAGVQTSHGPIATAVSSALSSTLGSREGTMQATATSGTTVSELLQKAARLYEHGDTDGAEKLRAAAEVLQGQHGGAVGGVSAAGPPAAANPAAEASPAGAGNPDASGAGMVGQMLGQVGQQVGQLVGMVTQPLAGIAHGLQQVPQQVMQAAQGEGSDKAASTRKDEPEEQDADEVPSEPNERREPAAPEQPAPGGAAAGESAGRAPEPPAVAERPQPAQTRPQVR